jgi:hypothetical protein
VIVIRWAATLIFLLCVALLATGNGDSWLMWAVTVALFAIAGWAWGATLGPWTGALDEDHPDSLGSLDMLQRHGAHQTTAGGSPPQATRLPDA